MRERVRADLPASGDHRPDLAPGETAGTEALAFEIEDSGPAERSQDRLCVRVLREVAVVERDHDRLGGETGAPRPGAAHLLDRHAVVAVALEPVHRRAEAPARRPELGI